MTRHTPHSFILFIILLFSTQAFAENYSFSYLTIKDGLSQNEVTSIVSDQYGFMWFGTRGGLNRYDGYKFEKFKPQLETNSLPNSSIERIYKDKKGQLWIGTKSGGCSVYDNQTQSFLTIKALQGISTRIISFYEDNESNMWIGGWNGGVWKYHPDSSHVSHFLGSERVNYIMQARNGIIYFATSHGLQAYNNGQFRRIEKANNNEITKMEEDPTSPYLWIVGWGRELTRFNYEKLSLKQYPIKKENTNTYTLLFDKDSLLWIGCWGNGLLQFDTKSEQFKSFEIKNNSTQENNIYPSIILDIFQDFTGELWIGTDGAGIVKLSKMSGFHNLNSKSFPNASNLRITCIYKDSKNRLWLGTKGRGIIVVDENGQRIPVDISLAKTATETEDVRKIYEDKNGDIWVCYSPDFFVCDGKSQNIKLLHPSYFFKSPNLVRIRKIHDIIEYKNDLWIGTQQNGIYIFNKENNQYALKKRFIASDELGNIQDNRVTTFKTDEQNNLWVGTYKGLLRYNNEDSTFTKLTDLLPKDQTPLGEIILCSSIDSENNLWIGTPCSLMKLSGLKTKNYNIEIFTTANGLPDDYINAIQCDSAGMLWVSTNAGISKVNPKTKQILNYNENDGISGISSYEGSSFKDKNGVMYFGGNGGLNYFHPGEIKTRKTIPKIAITQFRILNKNVPITSNGILVKNINEQKSLRLSYKEREFSFEFSALDYKAPSLNNYAYCLAGYSTDTIFLGNRRHISFSNLSAGDYSLSLMGSDSNGNWNIEGEKIQIQILPPPWKTWYAILIYAIVIFGIFFIISSAGVKQEKLQSIIKIERLKLTQTEAMNEYKLQFFTNISHEFRTPLTLISAPVSELVSKNFSELDESFFKSKLAFIQYNTNRLLALVNQLLEFRRLEVGKASLEANPHPILQFVSEICDSFTILAQQQHIDFSKSVKIDEQDLYFDYNKLDITINNLLSNAFKYSDKENGQVKVTLSENENEIKITVWNNGKGIDEIDLNKVFDRFYQPKGKSYFGSSGIGLALVKSYVDLHHGTIDVQSKANEFTAFTIALPKGKSHLSENELAPYSTSTSNQTNVVLKPSETKKNVHTEAKGATVLIVEDNTEVRNYLISLLSGFFEILEAENGLEGYNKCIKFKPELVITDVMMPIMDGFEFCEKIKKNDITAHIPVIMLTAKDTNSNKLFGTKKGADDYITKPFEPTYLLEKVKQIIASRKIASKKFSKKIRLELNESEIENEDAVFIQALLKIIEKNLKNPALDQELLASEMALSVSTFYRRVKKITTLPPGLFIRSVKLKKAAELLEKSQLTVSEIIEELGYLDSKNFRTIFKKEFGVTPSEYRNNKNA